MFHFIYVFATIHEKQNDSFGHNGLSINLNIKLTNPEARPHLKNKKRQNRAKIKLGGKKDNGCSKKVMLKQAQIIKGLAM